MFSDCTTVVPRIILFIINFCEVKHKGINGNVNLIILVSGINGRGPNDARNALTLWNEFCCSGLDRFIEEFVAVNWSLVECMSYWIGLSIAISSLPKVTNHSPHHQSLK
jgi:hypothetical protein